MSNNELLPEFRKVILQFLSKALAVACVGFLFFAVFKAAKELGGTHPLAVFGVGAAITILLSLYDGIKTNKATKFQWTALIVNVTLLIFFALMLPTKDAIDVLNKSGVEQNYLELLLKKYISQ